jgi:glucose-6-phosphate 1-dehydrogenase
MPHVHVRAAPRPLHAPLPSLKRAPHPPAPTPQVAAEASAAEEARAPGGVANRLFYFALPPSVFVVTAESVKTAAMSPRGWNRVVVEKPFGRDSASFAELDAQISRFFSEEQVYRIDHYLGKEMVQNLMVLRFANAVFEPLWNRDHVSTVQISFKEPFGTEGRGGYFDEFGIIRDVMQNHLLQVMSLVAMETPVSLAAEDVRDEKVKVMRCISPLAVSDVVLGQYGPNAAGSKPGYTDDSTVPLGSVTPTFATALLHVNNSRWRGVPFVLKCGKALNERKAEIRIQFKEPPNGLFSAQRRGVGQGAGGGAGVGDDRPHPNELVISIQPNEAVYLKMQCKMPGLEFRAVETELALSYKSRYPSQPAPEAYARLLLDVFRGDQSQFVRADELAAAWAIFTPLLHRIDAKEIVPTLYPYGSRGPPASDALIASAGYVWEGRYAGEWRRGHEPEAGTGALSALRSEFSLSTDRLVTLTTAFLADMRAGLAGDPSATIKMIPAYVTAVPSGAETGRAWALDMGGSNVRIVEVVAHGGRSLAITREQKRVIPVSLMSAPGAALFDYLADACVEGGIPEDGMLGFTFSFPTAQSGTAEGSLIEWTKGFSNSGVVGEEVVGLLRAALARKGRPGVRVAALVNDTVGTLIAGAYCHGPSTKVGVILGTGTNACYVEQAENIVKWKGAPSSSPNPPALTGPHLINMEWGGFGSSSSLALPLHGADAVMDAYTPNVGRQRFEKMIAGMYLGELARLLLVQLVSAGAVFAGNAGSPPVSSAGGGHVGGPPSARKPLLYTPWALSTEALAAIAGDSTPGLDVVGAVLVESCGVSGTSGEDRRVSQEMARLVSTRAARLASAGVAAVLQQMGPAGAGAVVAVDGSVFKKYPGYRQVRARLSQTDSDSGLTLPPSPLRRQWRQRCWSWALGAPSRTQRMARARARR